MAQGWEGTGRVTSPARRLLVGSAVLVAVLVLGVLARPGGSGAPGGTIDVSPDDLAPQEEVARTDPPRPSPPAAGAPAPPEPAEGSTQLEGALVGRWVSRAAPADLDATQGAVAWDGARHLFVFGGEAAASDGLSTEHQDTAWLYDLVDDEWRMLPDAPLAPRARAAAAWTGREFVVWGGIGRTEIFADGAAYDPQADRWRALAPSPLSPRHGLAAVRTAAGALLLIGGEDNGGGRTEVARYDPAGDAWTAAAPLPVAAPRWSTPAVALRAEEEVLVWHPEPWGPSTPPPSRFAADGWSPTTLPMGRASSLSVEQVGGGAIYGVLGRPGGQGHLQGELLALPAGEPGWRRVAEVPFPSHETFVTAGMGERYLVVLDLIGGGAAFDIEEARWLELPTRALLSGGAQGLHTFPTDEGFLVFGPSPLRTWEVRHFVLEGEARP